MPSRAGHLFRPLPRSDYQERTQGRLAERQDDERELRAQRRDQPGRGGRGAHDRAQGVEPVKPAGAPLRGATVPDIEAGGDREARSQERGGRREDEQADSQMKRHSTAPEAQPLGERHAVDRQLDGGEQRQRAKRR